MRKKQQVDEVQIPWKFNGGREVVVPEWAIGFVYLITHKIGRKELLYVGKKQLTINRKQKIGKRAIASERADRADGKAHTVRRVVKSSGWEHYWGSSKSLHAARETGEGTWQRTIVVWCHSKKHMSYEETKWQYMMKVLETESYNDHIQNWFRKDLIKPNV